MKISIITVCFNSAATIGRTLRSVADQTYPNIEHLVIDGGSSDDTLGIVARDGQHVARVVSEKDDGIYDAMNKGIRLATGDVIAFLNADDVYRDDDVVATVAELMQGEDLDALYGDVEYFKDTQPEKVVRTYDSAQFTPRRLAFGWMPAHPALFVRADVFRQVGLFATDYRIAGDFEFIARVFSKPACRYRHLPRVLVRMQMGGVSTSGWRATLLLNAEILRACRANGIKSNRLMLASRYPLKVLELFRRRRPSHSG